MFIEPYLGNVTPFAGNFAPRGWMFCNGALLSIAEYSALYALIGTTYGGDGQETFALPDLRSRTPIHAGQGLGLSMYYLGQMAGTENTTLLQTNLPIHTHALLSFTGSQPISTATTGGDNPTNAFPASGGTVYNTQSPDGTRMGSYSSISTTVLAGASSPVSIVQPYLAMNYVIAVEGIFPSRN